MNQTTRRPPIIKKENLKRTPQISDPKCEVCNQNTATRTVRGSTSRQICEKCFFDYITEINISQKLINSKL